MKTETRTTLNTDALDDLIKDACRYRWLKLYGKAPGVWSEAEIDREICKDDIITNLNEGATS